MGATTPLLEEKAASRHRSVPAAVRRGEAEGEEGRLATERRVARGGRADSFCYDLDNQQELVQVVAVGYKDGHKLFEHGEEYEL